MPTTKTRDAEPRPGSPSTSTTRTSGPDAALNERDAMGDRIARNLFGDDVVDAAALEARAREVVAGLSERMRWIVLAYEAAGRHVRLERPARFHPVEYRDLLQLAGDPFLLYRVEDRGGVWRLTDLGRAVAALLTSEVK